MVAYLLAVMSAGFMFITAVGAQDPAQEEDARRLWDTEFLKKRAEAKAAAAASPARKSTGYRRVASKTPKPEARPAESKVANEKTEKPEKVEGEMIGVTIWRLRAAKQADSQDARLLLEDEESRENVEWTLERVESETAFAPNDRVRLAIESPRNGYLYVINREQYADGTLSDPYLIFPTLRTRNGDNAVKAGKVIELPGRSAFRLKPMRPDYAGEVLTVLVTNEPLKDVSIGPRIVKLDKALVDAWEKQWNAAVERFELIGGAGKPYSRAEKEAGQEGSRILTQDDELPQTLYRIIAPRGNALLISVALRIGR